jgi:E3 ubiquitin-protein ligase BRE1
MDFTTLEEKVQILHAEKAKADQKYFAARKDMDTRILEVRSLKIQNQKSSEIIQQLKEVETANRNLLSNLEKQLSDIRQANASIITEHKKMESTSREATSKAETLRNQVTELTNLIKAKDANNLNTKQRIHDVEIELEQIRVKYEQAQKDRDTWKTKSLSNQSGEEEMLRVSSNAQGSLSLLTMLDSCSVHYLPEQLQERRHQDVWSYFLQQLC